MCSRVGGGGFIKRRAHVKLTKGQRDLALIHRAVFKCVSKVMLCLLWFCFTLLSDWLKKLTLTQPVRRKTETNHDLVARILLHLTLITVVCALISDNLAHFVFNLFLLLLVRVITLVLVLLHSFENCSYK